MSLNAGPIALSTDPISTARSGRAPERREWREWCQVLRRARTAQDLTLISRVLCARYRRRSREHCVRTVGSLFDDVLRYPVARRVQIGQDRASVVQRHSRSLTSAAAPHHGLPQWVVLQSYAVALHASHCQQVLGTPAIVPLRDPAPAKRAPRGSDLALCKSARICSGAQRMRLQPHARNSGRSTIVSAAGR